MELEARTNEGNPDPRVACALLLDTSWSMTTDDRIGQLNQGFETFCEDIKKDPLAQKRTEVCVITFGGTARVEIPFTEGRDLQPREFTPEGSTPLGAALDLALDELEAQKQAYREAGLEYFRPWLFILTDGSPTDGDIFERAAARVVSTESRKGVAVFSVYIEGGDAVQLKKLSEVRTPVQLKNEPGVFRELFAWLSASMQQVSNSSQYGASDDSVEEGQTPLPGPEGWATW